MIVFKVCRRVLDGVFTSAIYKSQPYENRLTSHYAIDETTYPHAANGPLCAFDTLDNAIAFVRGVPLSFFPEPFVIFRCTAEKSEATSIWDIRYGRIRSNEIPLCIAPTGTILCSSIRPTAIEYIQEEKKSA